MKKLMMAVAGVMMIGAAMASTATTFAYQGVLRDEFGKVLDDNTATIEFRLYEGVDSDTAVWGRRMVLAIDTNGLFNAELSDGNGTAITGISGTIETGVASTLENVLAHAEKNGKSVYVGLTVQNSSGEIRPRQKLLPVPMAGYAQNAQEAKGDFAVGGDLTVSGAIGVKNGTLTSQNISVEGMATFNKSVQMEEGAIIGGSDANATNLTVNGTAVVKGAVTASGSVTAGDSLTVSKGNINLPTTGKLLLGGRYEASMPIGSIIIWSGKPDASALPPGWVLCAPDSKGNELKYTNPTDGNVYSVPDLRGRFVLGANRSAVGSDGSTIEPSTAFTQRSSGDTGGVERVTLTINEMPAHRHRYLSDDQLYNDNVKSQYDKYAHLVDDSHKQLSFDFNSDGGKNGCIYQNESVGGSKDHENMPPFYALCYIIFVGDTLVK